MSVYDSVGVFVLFSDHDCRCRRTGLLSLSLLWSNGRLVAPLLKRPCHLIFESINLFFHSLSSQNVISSLYTSIPKSWIIAQCASLASMTKCFDIRVPFPLQWETIVLTRFLSAINVRLLWRTVWLTINTWDFSCFIDCVLTNGTAVPTGASMAVDCNTCICLNGTFACSELVCEPRKHIIQCIYWGEGRGGE